MRFIYNNRQFEVVELQDIGGICSMGMCALFEVEYCHYEKGTRVVNTEEEFLDQDNQIDAPIICEELKFINYFFMDNREQDYIIEQCQYFIDHEYDKNFDACKCLMREVRKAQIEFENDIANGYSTKGSLDRLEYAQSDLYDYIKENIKVD